MINSNIPKIRFKEFINNWNNYKLGELGNFKSGIGFPDSQQGGTEGIPFFKVSDMNYIGNETEMRNANNYVTQDQIIKNSWKVINETPAIIFAKVGAALMLNRKRLVTRPFLIDNNTMSYSFDESWDKDFGLTLFQTINLPKYAQIGALPSYNASDIAMIKVNVPDIQEQSAIGTLFRTLDDLLASYKDNLANYQSLKATMLSKMFPKAGHTIPEIRLDGFEGEWECIKMADIFQIIDGDRGKSYPGESDFSSFGHTLFLDTGNVKKTGLDFSTTKFISEEKDKELRNGKLTLGDFILTSRGTLGNVAYYDENIQKRFSSVRINSAMLILRPLLGDKISPEYILAVLRGNLISDFMKVNQVGSAQPHITKKEFSKIKVLVPSNIQEQRAIGSYFSNLDNLINSYQDKISQLETLKKKLLQDMFI